MPQYGLISKVDAACIEKTLDLICDEFKNGKINITEIGVYSGMTGVGICKYLFNRNRHFFYTGIENGKDGEELKNFQPFASKLIVGDSNVVYNQLEDNSLHFLFIDACHCFAHVVSDFFCYSPKVKVGGYLAFHDTGKHIKPFKDFQHGDKDNPDAYISVRKALTKIGLFSTFLPYSFEDENKPEHIKWQLIFDEADENDQAGGICVFKKLY